MLIKLKQTYEHLKELSLKQDQTRLNNSFTDLGYLIDCCLLTPLSALLAISWRSEYFFGRESHGGRRESPTFDMKTNNPIDD